MAERGDLRASDREREDAAAAIRAHFAEGRLDADELAERLQAVYAAKTVAELDQARSDLPPVPPSPREQRAELVERRRHLQRRLVQQSGGGLAVFVVCAVIWAASGGGSFWPVWVLIVVLLPLLTNGWRLYGPAPELDRVEAELNRGDQRGAARPERHAERAERRQERSERRAERRSRRR